LNRQKEPTKHSRVCSDHFVTGKFSVSCGLTGGGHQTLLFKIL
jgi:hypothetical protein